MQAAFHPIAKCMCIKYVFFYVRDSKYATEGKGYYLVQNIRDAKVRSIDLAAFLLTLQIRE